MLIRIKDDYVEVSGYVNAIERKSKPLNSRMGQFIERICKGAFKKALSRNNNIRLLLNHDWKKDLGGTRDGNLELTEDNIGLHARAIIKDTDVIEKARNGDLVGWSFGFFDRDVEHKRDENGMPLREVKDLDLEEVSLLDRSHKPAYDGTLVSVRADDAGKAIFCGEPFYDEAHTRDIATCETTVNVTALKENIDYSIYEQIINELKNDGLEENQEKKPTLYKNENKNN